MDKRARPVSGILKRGHFLRGIKIGLRFGKRAGRPPYCEITGQSPAPLHHHRRLLFGAVGDALAVQRLAERHLGTVDIDIGEVLA